MKNTSGSIEKLAYTREECAAALSIHPNTLDKLVEDGLPYVMWGPRLIRFPVDQVRAYLAARSISTNGTDDAKRTEAK